MRKIEIELSEEQYQLLNQEIAKTNDVNLIEETFSGTSIGLELTTIEGGISWIDVQTPNKVELGEVTWSLT